MSDLEGSDREVIDIVVPRDIAVPLFPRHNDCPLLGNGHKGPKIRARRRDHLLNDCENSDWQRTKPAKNLSKPRWLGEIESKINMLHKQ